ncbi:MAG: glutamate-cysteine ligase family protein [Acidobacteriota bacterium]
MTRIPPEAAPGHPWYSPEAGGINRIAFNGSPDPTLGVEIELQIIDPETGDLAPGGPQIIDAHGKPEYVKPELLQSTVELNVGPCADISEARRSLGRRLSALHATAARLGFAMISAGTHPFALWEEQKISKQARYQRLLACISHRATSRGRGEARADKARAGRAPQAYLTIRRGDRVSATPSPWA